MAIEQRIELIMSSNRPTGAFCIAAPHYIDPDKLDNYLIPEAGWHFIFKPFVDDMIKAAGQVGTSKCDIFLQAVSKAKGVNVGGAFEELSRPPSDSSTIPASMPCVKVGFEAMSLLLRYIEESCAQILEESPYIDTSNAFKGLPQMAVSSLTFQPKTAA